MDNKLAVKSPCCCKKKVMTWGVVTAIWPKLASMSRPTSMRVSANKKGCAAMIHKFGMHLEKLTLCKQPSSMLSQHPSTL
eukprot:1153408-Pelagomonas_calceolata.AAC.1